MRSKHVIICGAGIIGLCCAYYLRQRGHGVTVIERSPQDRDGCSFGNAGMVVPSHFIPLAAPGMVALGLKWMADPASPFYIRPRLDAELLGWGWRFMRSANVRNVERSSPLLRDLNLASRKLYEELAGSMNDEFGLVKRGLLMLCKTEQGLEEETAVAERAERLGIPARVLTPAAVAQLDPGVRMDVAGAVHFPLDCHLQPQRLMGALLKHVQQAGVEVRFATEVSGWKTAQGSVHAVVLQGGAELPADEFIVAGGAWSPALVRGLGAKLPMQAGKGYSITLANPPYLPELCSVLVEARVAVTPMEGSLRVGGTMELSGMDGSIRPERVRGILAAIPRYFPDFAESDFDRLPVWSGLRPCSPDGLPYLGRVGGYRNLTAATGHAMMGISLGPITGRLVAELLSDERPSIALELLEPNRFS